MVAIVIAKKRESITSRIIQPGIFDKKEVQCIKKKSIASEKF